MIVDDKIMNYVLYKMRTISEVRNKCARLKLEESYIDDVIEYLIEAGYLDDKKYAYKYVENVFRLKKASRNEIKIDLMKKGIDSNIIDEAVDTEEAYDFEVSSCEYVAEKKFRSTPDVLKLRKYLISKGYDYDVISKTIDNLSLLEDN